MRQFGSLAMFRDAHSLLFTYWPEGGGGEIQALVPRMVTMNCEEKDLMESL